MEKKEGCPFTVACEYCGFRRGEQCRFTTELEHAEVAAREVRAEEEMFSSFKALIGCKVTDVFKYNRCYDTGVLIALVFENGEILSAEDGEYGDNAFKFTTREQIKEETNGLES